jgi:hypothetical protein
MLQLELEKEAAAENARLLAEIREYKAMMGPLFAHCRARGIPEPELFPHPDDFFIDEQTQRAEIRGPRTPEQKAQLDKIMAQRDGYQRGVSGHQAAAAAKPRDWTLPMLAVMAQEYFDAINDLLPERYRKKLQDRMSAAQIGGAREKTRKGLEARKRRQRRQRAARGRRHDGSPRQ